MKIVSVMKNDKLKICYNCIFEYVNDLSSSLFPMDYNFFSGSKNSWDEMLNPDECLFSYKCLLQWSLFKETYPY
jgi:hypothetical protein